MKKSNTIQVGIHCPAGLASNSHLLEAWKAKQKSKHSPVKIYTKEEIEAYKAKRGL